VPETVTSTFTHSQPTPAASNFSARGKMTGRVGTDGIKFNPSNTNYELHLVAPSYAGPMNTLTSGIVRVVARKVYTVPSGGNFINPIFGQPRTIQGRVRSVDGNSIVVHAGTNVHVKLPDESSAVELANGAIAVGSLVNVVALPGATFEEMRNAE
jgi:hypothetical protein